MTSRPIINVRVRGGKGARVFLHKGALSHAPASIPAGTGERNAGCANICARLRWCAAVLCVRVHPSIFKFNRQHAAGRQVMCTCRHLPWACSHARHDIMQCGRGTCALMRLVCAYTDGAGPGKIAASCEGAQAQMHHEPARVRIFQQRRKAQHVSMQAPLHRDRISGPRLRKA
eukprot:6179071-Pleurochrysis_carterae.AAC.2